jgi:hypothetical protein
MVRRIPPSVAVLITVRTSCESPMFCTVIAIMYDRNQYLEAKMYVLVPYCKARTVLYLLELTRLGGAPFISCHSVKRWFSVRFRGFELAVLISLAEINRCKTYFFCAVQDCG